MPPQGPRGSTQAYCNGGWRNRDTKQLFDPATLLVCNAVIIVFLTFVIVPSRIINLGNMHWHFVLYLFCVL